MKFSSHERVKKGRGTPLERFLRYVRPGLSTECWLWKGSLNSNGYGQIYIDGRPKGAHVLSYLLYRGEVPSGLWVLHTCDVPTCVNPDHLWLGTNADNSRDRALKRRCYQRKLTDSQVLEVHRCTESACSLARRFGVSPAAISAVRRKRSLVHVLEREVA